MTKLTCGYPSCGCFSILGDVTKGPQPGCPKGRTVIKSVAEGAVTPEMARHIYGFADGGGPGLARLKANSDYDAVVARPRVEQERAMREVREGRTEKEKPRGRKPKKEGYPISK